MNDAKSGKNVQPMGQPSGDERPVEPAGGLEPADDQAEPNRALQLEATSQSAGSLQIDDATRSHDDELVLRIPEGALIPEGASFFEGDDDGRCRLVRQDGRRCQATRVRATGLCPGHGGNSGLLGDPAAASRLGHERKRQMRERRLLLGISTRRAAQPVQLARLRAQERADDFATAVVDGPLDDETLGSVQRQTAAIRALELLYPQVTATLDVEVPSEPDGVAGMGWSDLQLLAGRLLGDGHQADTT